MIVFREITQKLTNGSRFFVGVIKANTISLFSKRNFLIFAFFALFGTGGVVAATNISINSAIPVSLGAGYSLATSCDENVTVKALTAPDAATGQFYVATIALSDVDQTPVTGCGYRNAEVALKINGQMTYASWTIIPSATNDTFSFTGATFSINNKYANTLLTPFQADGLTNVAVKMSGGYKVGDTGPGGGVIFYASTTGFNCGPSYTATGSPYNFKCYYLEAAPTTGANAWTDAAYVWSGNTTTVVNNASAPETATATAIGWGYRNTLAMVLQNSTADRAGTISRAYRGPNNLSDWYLPSFDELNQMCKWAKGQDWTSDATVCNSSGTINTGAGAAGFGNYDYWSSSDRGTGYGDYARYQWFPTGIQGWTAKLMTGQNLYVRPIRAF